MTAIRRRMALAAVLAASVAQAGLAQSRAIAEAQSSRPGWKLVWSDEFNGKGLPSSRSWSYHVGNGSIPGLDGFQGWGNAELQWYRPESCTLSGGHLVIRADYDEAPATIAGRDWHVRSCRITTQGKRAWTYGRIEARIAAPNAAGAWPAFWMTGTSSGGTTTAGPRPPAGAYDSMASHWPSCGEIDVLEKRDYETANVNNAFWDVRTGVFPWTAGQTANHVSTTEIGDLSQFHVYAIEWDAQSIRWFVDDRQTHALDTTPETLEEFRQPFYVILNLAVGGNFPRLAPDGAEFPLFMRVDYVRVYRKR